MKHCGVLRIIIEKNANNMKPKLKFQVNDYLITVRIEIANSFNEFFVTIGPKLAQTIKSTTSPMSCVNNCKTSIVIPPVTMAEVRQTVLSLKNLIAGWNDLPAVVVKPSIESFIDL